MYVLACAHRTRACALLARVYVSAVWRDGPPPLWVGLEYSLNDTVPYSPLRVCGVSREARERESEGKCEGERRAGTVRATGGEISMSAIELGVDES